MKKFVITILGCFIIGLLLIPELASGKNEKPRQGIRNGKGKSSESKSSKGKSSAVKIADANAISKTGKSNKAVGAKIEPGSWKNVNRERSRVMSRWLHGNIDDKAGLALAVQDQAIAELMYLRQQAVKEGAGKTIKAIDMLISARRNDYDKIGKMVGVEVTKKNRAMREERKKALMEHMKNRGRAMKGESREKGERRSRKTADANNVDNQKQGIEE